MYDSLKGDSLKLAGFWLLAPVVLLAASALAVAALADDVGLRKEGCELPANLPNSVLFSTDISTVDYLPKIETHLFEVQYFEMEQGGGGTELTIKSQDDKVTIIREFLEPGEVPHERGYQVQCQGETFMAGEGFALQWVPDGLIWWESDSQTNALPNDMWYFMESVPALP